MAHEKTNLVEKRENFIFLTFKRGENSFLLYIQVRETESVKGY